MTPPRTTARARARAAITRTGVAAYPARANSLTKGEELRDHLAELAERIDVRVLLGGQRSAAGLLALRGIGTRRPVA